MVIMYVVVVVAVFVGIVYLIYWDVYLFIQLMCFFFFLFYTVLESEMLQLAMQLKLFNVYYIIGGVWTSVVTISSKSNDRLQGAEEHFFKPTLCVFFVEENSDIAAWKLGDKNIYEMMHFEGKAVSWIEGA